MRTLSRRTKPADSRFIMVPTAAVTDPGRSRSRARAARRRLLLSRLLWASALTLAMALFLGGPWWYAHLLADAGLVGFVLWLRRTALAAAAAAREGRRAALAQIEEEHRQAYLASRTAQILDLTSAGRPAAESPRRAVND